MESGRPDPSRAADLAEYIAMLGRLRVWAGSPSFRTLAQRVGPLLRPPQRVAHSTIGDVFRTGRRRLDLDLVAAVVRALGLDEREVNRWRDACVAVHDNVATGGPVGVFRQLPADLATFTGRADSLRIIEDAASSGGTAPQTVVISAIEGMAGVGKTRLAIHLAHQLVRSGRYSDVQLYVNLRGFDPERPPIDPAAVLDSFLRQLEVAPQHVPETLDERAAMFRNRLDGKQALIVLDNVFSEEQVRHLIPASPSCLVLVTSRRTLAGLEGAVLHRLDVFSEHEALALLARIVGAARVSAEPDAAREVARLCGYLPLALGLAGARLRARPAWTLADLVAKLSAGVSAMSVGKQSVDGVFDLSYRALSEPAQRTFRLLGRLPGADFSAPAVAALTGGDAAEAAGLLEYLLDENLIEQKTVDRYEMHDVVRRFATERAAADPAAGDAAVAGLAVWYLHTAMNAATAINTLELPDPTGVPPVAPLGFDSAEAALAWFDAERANLAAVMEAAVSVRLYEVAWQMAVARKRYLRLRRHLQDFLESQELALTAARAAGDPPTEALCVSGLGSAYWAMGRLEEAETYFRQAGDCYRALGDRIGLARQMMDLASVQAMRDEFASADELFTEALPLLEGPDLARLSGLCLTNRGAVRLFLGRPEKAVTDYRNALPYLRQAGDESNEAMALGNLAEALAVVGDTEQALDYYHRQHALAVRSNDVYYQAEGFRGLGDVYQVTGDRDLACDYWTKALELYETIGHPHVDSMRERLKSPDITGPIQGHGPTLG